MGARGWPKEARRVQKSAVLATGVGTKGTSLDLGFLLACLLWVSTFIMLFAQSWEALLLVLSVICVAVCGGAPDLSTNDLLGVCDKGALDVFSNNSAQRRARRGAEGVLVRNNSAEPSEQATGFFLHEARRLFNDNNDLLELRTSPGKGLGVFAKRRIARGTQVLVEEPLFSIDPPEPVNGRRSMNEMAARINASFAVLSPAQQAAYLACQSYAAPDEPAVGRHLYVFRNNAYTMPGGRWGMFLRMARINHSCRPNVANAWAEPADGRGTGRKVAWALRDIEAGEEVLVTYVRLLQRASARQRRLAQYGFRCGCAACREPNGEEDARRERAGELMAELGAAGEQRPVNNGVQLLDKAQELVGLLEGEGLDDYLAVAYGHAARFAAAAGRLLEAKGWAGKALELHRFAGEDSLAARTALSYLQGLG
jgi:hypothetical protein